MSVPSLLSSREVRTTAVVADSPFPQIRERRRLLRPLRTPVRMDVSNRAKAALRKVEAEAAEPSAR